MESAPRESKPPSNGSGYTQNNIAEYTTHTKFQTHDSTFSPHSPCINAYKYKTAITGTYETLKKKTSVQYSHDNLDYVSAVYRQVCLS